ncbi:MAG: hypothetical protein ACK2VA_11805 [Anaerolineae bacterium]
MISAKGRGTDRLARAIHRESGTFTVLNGLLIRVMPEWLLRHL